MKRLFIGLTLTIGFISGCQSNQVEEVENKHGAFTNREGLDNFVKKVQNEEKAQINYIQYGVEGQRGVDEISYNGNSLNVSRNVDKEFVQEYQCKTIERQTGESETTYILKQCTDGLGDVELVTVKVSK